MDKDALPSAKDADATSKIQDIDPKDIDDIKATAQMRFQRGDSNFDDIVEGLCANYELEGDGSSTITNLVESVLQKLITAQAEWPENETQDMGKLTKAFEALDKGGVVARANFTCCSTCGNYEIGAEASSKHVGYCFFHEQDLERCIEGGELMLRFGVFGEDFNDPVKRAEIGGLVVQAMEEAGLTAVWNKDPKTTIEIPSFKWRVRLLDGGGGGNDEGDDEGDGEESEGEESEGEESEGEESEGEESEGEGSAGEESENEGEEEDEQEGDSEDDLFRIPLSEIYVR